MSIERHTQSLDYLVYPSFQGVNELFVSSFEDSTHRKSSSQYFLLTVEIEDYNVICDWWKILDLPVKNDIRLYHNIRNIAIGHRDDYTTGCLIDYVHLKNYYKMIVIDLSDNYTLDADPKAIQQINFRRNLDWAGNTTIFFIIEEVKEIILDFLLETVRVL